MSGRNKLLVAIGAVLLVGAFAWGIYWQAFAKHAELTLEQVLNIQGNPLELHLYALAQEPASGNKVRTLDRKMPNGRLTASYIWYRDHTTEDVHYDLDGIRKVASEDYFATTVNGGRLLRARAEFAQDGTYKFHEVHRMAGQLERIGHRERDGRYEQRYMFEDGVTPERIRWFDSSLQFLTESIYRWNASHSETYIYAKIVRADFPGQYYVSLYRPSGSLEAVLKLGADMDKGRLYDTDGATLLAEYGQDISGSRSYYIGYSQGATTPTTVWESAFGRTTVAVIDAATQKPVLRQTWKERPDPKAPGGKRYLLMNASEFDERQGLTMRVEMDKNGSRAEAMFVQEQPSEPEKAAVGGESTQPVQTQKPAVTLEEESPPLLLPRMKQRLQRYVEVDPKMLQMPTRPDVPTFDDFGPPPIYDRR